MARCRVVQKAAGVRAPRTLPVVLVAEGWTAAQEVAFDHVCAELWTGLLDVAPFGLLRRYPERVSVYSIFFPSDREGPGVVGAFGGATQSPAGSTWDPGTRELRVQVPQILNFLRATTVDDVSVENFVHGYPSAPGGVVAFLLPPVAGGAPFSAELDAVQPWAGSTFPPEQLRWVAATVDDGWQRVIARALARAFGLGDEWVAEGPEFVAIAAHLANGAFAAYPNLTTYAPPAGPPGPGFKWFQELDARGRSRPLTVVSAADQESSGGPAMLPTEPIGLVEGGGWYRTGVYRSAVHCFMRSRIGAAGSSPRASTTPFCEVCRRSLTRSIAGSTERRRRTGLDGQRSTFDTVSTWTDVTRSVGQLPSVVSVTDRTAASGPYWTFTARIGPSVGGLAIEDLRLRAQGTDLTAETVAELIEFRDLAVEFSDGTRATFDVPRALSSSATPPVLEVATDGQADATDNLYRHGLNLTLVDDFDGRCPVEIALSLVLRGEDVGIEPTNGLFACKFMPQISMRWLPGGTLSATRFRGCVRLVLNNAMRHGAGHHAHVPGTDPVVQVISMFTDGNSFIETPWDRRVQIVAGKKLQQGLVRPWWWAVFDYHNPDFRTEVEVAAVRGPRSPVERRAPRSDWVAWPPGSTSTRVTTTRERDQGQYDNVHMHGSMGPDPYDPRTPQQPMVHAPACAEACVHLHWRWGWPLRPLGTLLRHRRPADFMGWRRPLAYGRTAAHDEWGAPLVPPNQDLSVAVTHPGTMRGDPWSNVVSAAQGLHPERKAVWWTTDVTAPRREAPQVVLEPGLSYAYRYNWDAWLSEELRQAASELTWDGSGPDPRSRDELLHVGYSLSRWYLDAALTATSEQIPTGRDLGNSGVPLEDL